MMAGLWIMSVAQLVAGAHCSSMLQGMHARRPPAHKNPINKPLLYGSAQKWLHSVTQRWECKPNCAAEHKERKGCLLCRCTIVMLTRSGFVPDWWTTPKVVKQTDSWYSLDGVVSGCHINSR